MLGTRPDELDETATNNHPVARLVSTICRRCQSRLPTMCEWIPSCHDIVLHILDAAHTFTPTLAQDTIVVFQGRNEMTASLNLSSAPISLGCLDGWMDGWMAWWPLLWDSVMSVGFHDEEPTSTSPSHLGLSCSLPHHSWLRR